MIRVKRTLSLAVIGLALVLGGHAVVSAAPLFEAREQIANVASRGHHVRRHRGHHVYKKHHARRHYNRHYKRSPRRNIQPGSVWAACRGTHATYLRQRGYL